MNKKLFNRLTDHRVLYYYDLIELPSGAHVPVPITLTYVHPFDLSELMVSHRKRDHRFFVCPNCGNTSFYSTKHSRCESCGEYSDYESDIDESQAKLLALIQIIKKKQFRKLRYIKA